MFKLRIYVDTSVIGGCLDKEFEEESRALPDMARRGDVTLVISELLVAELRKANKEIQMIFDSLPDEYLDEVFISPESEHLRDLYLEGGVVGKSSSSDAHHVALASISRSDLIVSWNFKHIVHYEKIRGYNAINLREGYPMIDIRSPKEVV